MYINELKINRVFAKFKKMKFKYKLIFSFIFVSIIPILLGQSIFYYYTAASMKENVDELINFNLIQTEKNLNTTLNSYTDILYQIYTDDEIIDLVNKMNEESENAMEINRLREKLRKLTNSKSGIRSIAILCSSGKTVFYDVLTASSIESVWMNKSDFNKKTFYFKVEESNGAVLVPTTFAAQKYYLFHIANKIIDFKKIRQKPIGIVVISIDEDIIFNACNELKDFNQKNYNDKNINFIVDSDRRIVSFPDKEFIGSIIPDKVVNKRGQTNTQYFDVIKNSSFFTGQSFIINELNDKKTGWIIVNAYDRNYLFSRIHMLQRLTILFGVLAILFSIVIIIYITRNFSASIGKIIKAMKTAQDGELLVQVELDDSDDDEISAIASRFNKMILKINQLVEEVKCATFKQKEAEIQALEAQINPHFLYNTLDSINWMAIKKEEHEISNMLKSLAQILRYSVNKSNSVVKLREEIEWLKQYLYLQQTRFNYSFECFMEVDEDILGCMVHKLLLQPFIENVIIHGFEGVKKGGILKINIKGQGKYINITIEDNGKGMKEEVVKSLNSCEYDEIKTRGSGVGVKNVFDRIRMYYGESSAWEVVSRQGKGTTVYLRIPKM